MQDHPIFTQTQTPTAIAATTGTPKGSSIEEGGNGGGAEGGGTTAEENNPAQISLN